MAGFSRHSRTSRHSSHGESHGSYAKSMVDEMKLKDQALDLRIKMIKKALAAAKVASKEMQAIGLNKEEAGRLALEMFDLSNDEHHGGGH